MTYSITRIARLAVAGIALTAGSSVAATLTTAPLSSAGNEVACTVANVSTKTRAVDIVLIGEIEEDRGSVPLASASAILDPDGITSLRIGANTIDFTTFCRIAVEGGKQTVRGVLSIGNEAEGTQASVEAR